MSDSLPTFKEMVANDVANAFFNLDEFAEVLRIDNKDVVAVKDDDALSDYNSRLTEGLIKCDLLYHVPVSEFLKPLFVGKSVVVKNKAYLIESIKETTGVYTFLLAGKHQ